MTLYRCFPWNDRVRSDDPDGPLWFPRMFQGEGRHDNPQVYGCLYLADRPVSCITEQLAAFRGQRLIASMLRRRRLPLALAAIELDDEVPLLDLDDPAVLRRERLRPSRVATRERSITQPEALRLFLDHAAIGGLRWWSRWESLWTNVTVFDRAAPSLRVGHVEALTLETSALLEAAEMFGLRVTRG